MLKIIIGRIKFALAYKTLKTIALNSKKDRKILVYHQGKVEELSRYCPHQGALMENGLIKDGALICPWHGCRISLEKKCALITNSKKSDLKDQLALENGSFSS